MQISSQFTIAIHMLSYIALYQNKQKVTSDILSGSIEVNPVIIRRLLSRLKGDGMITVHRGTGGTFLARKPEDITLLDVYRSVENLKEEGLFHFHEHPNPLCPVGRGIHHALDGKLMEVQKAMEEKMKSYTLADVIKEIPV
ncbi:Rrf2 family transcriptional regulator [Dialister sp.]|uniref:Rrf2 family transcriptional regulator n=1 Tax=Dialister sp. TaxID=1955814 RepID=UPI003EFC08FC